MQLHAVTEAGKSKIFRVDQKLETQEGDDISTQVQRTSAYKFHLSLGRALFSSIHAFNRFDQAHPRYGGAICSTQSPTI